MTPVLFLEPKRLYNGLFDGDPHKPAVTWANHELGEVPEGHYTIDFETARQISEGNDLTILCYGTMVWVAEAAVKATGVSADILDLRSLLPLDLDAIVKSVNKTGRCLVLHEATRTSGFGAELIAEIQQHCFYGPRSAPSCASPAGIPLIRMRSNGNISRALNVLPEPLMP